MVRVSTLAATGVAVAAAAAAGGLASREVNSPWYASLDKPSWQPPHVAFPLAWTVLYADIAATSAAVLDQWHARGERSPARAYRRALAVNLAVNASWSWAFFRYRRLGTAVVVAGALTASSTDLARRAGAADPRAGRALAPYAAWCGFATVLSAAIWRRNR